ncbi:hypothetical protein RJ640_028783 [Escallonia rubra]|uniref:Retrotransposon gag domain-containing protein n=1 Tax=Escallonia rubra TaxID=112253 RepID=A0AA88UBM0_9ASTE|nr:hypothetical protein RJ640_028783 [Escallonia rubra]
MNIQPALRNKLCCIGGNAATYDIFNCTYLGSRKKCVDGAHQGKGDDNEENNDTTREPEPDKMTQILEALVKVVQQPQQTVVAQQNDDSRIKRVKAFKDLEAPKFEGSTDPMDVDNWIQGIKKGALHMGEVKEAFKEKYQPKSVRLQKKMDFIKLEQRNKSVAEYDVEFTDLSKFAPELIADEESRARKFESGLRHQFKQFVEAFELETYADVLSKVLLVEKGLNDAQKDRDNNQKKRQRSENSQGGQNLNWQTKK